MRFEVDDIEAAVTKLRDRGANFDKRDLPGLKAAEGIARHESGARGEWYTHPDRNILEIAQFFNR
ncbi:MAG: VOC family protein [Solirubrobacteraceae bacterium]